MGKIYDDWERLVEVVMRREQLRNLSLSDSTTSSSRSLNSDYSLSSSSWNIDDNLSFRATPSPLYPDVAKLSSGNLKLPTKRRNAMWRGFSIFGVFASKDYGGREEKELKWAKDRKTLHGHEPMKAKYENASQMAEEAKRRAEIARLQELHTLKGHINALVKAKGLDIDLIHHYYTV